MASITKSTKLFQVSNTLKMNNFGSIRCVLKTNLLCRNFFTKYRCYSTATDDQSSSEPKTITKKDIIKFEKVFPDILKDLMNGIKIQEVTSRFTESLMYNVPHGKKNRGLTVVESYKILEKPERLTSNNIYLGNILGWTVEMLQAFLLVMDDVTDTSETRRGQLCWYKHQHIGLTAINDGLLLENSIYFLLNKYFRHHPSYVDLIELFQDVTRMTLIGQIMDSNIVNVRSMTIRRFEHIACYKTAYYSFYLPVFLAMYLSNFTNPKISSRVKDILLDIGKFFQIQDDFLDCFGEPAVTGKVGTDIETGKCTWLAASAVERATEKQKQILEENYGRMDAQNVKIVKDLYIELGLPKLFFEYEEKSYQLFQSRIQQLSKEFPVDVFHKVVSKIYKRAS